LRRFFFSSRNGHPAHMRFETQQVFLTLTRFFVFDPAIDR
jgi:hypothetical protein